MLFHSLIGLGLWGFVSSSVGHDVPTVGATPAKSRAPIAPQTIVIPLFTPKEFPFVTTIPDDGRGKGGGWQVAKVNLEFIHVVIPTNVRVWHCPFKIEMPLRTEFRGKVPASLAADMSAKVANRVDAGIDHSLPEGVFCIKFRTGMETTFPSMYPGLGERITK